MLKIDLHIHTIASGHAFNTILEYVNQAKKLKMSAIGISDHGNAGKNSLTSEAYFRVLASRMPVSVNGIRILKGAEANIIDQKGSLDISEKVINRLDYVMAGLHFNCGYNDLGREINTRTVINAIRSGKINVLTHPSFTEDFDIDLEKISKDACKNNVLLEINLSHIREDGMKQNVISNMKKIVSVVKSQKKKIIVGSDAHNIWELGDDANLKKYKKEIGLTDNMIINNYPKELFKLLKIND